MPAIEVPAPRPVMGTPRTLATATVAFCQFASREQWQSEVVPLTMAAIITYLVVAILSWREGYRLSLAGVAGLIVAIGITADSFIVYFERIRDELRDGRGLESAVEAGWKRALRRMRK